MCSLECGDIFFANQTTWGMETPCCRDTNMSFFFESESAIEEIEEVTNLIA